MPRPVLSPRSDRGQGPAFQSWAIFLPSLSVTSLCTATRVLMLSSASLGRVCGLEQLAGGDTGRETCLGMGSMVAAGGAGRPLCSQGLRVRAGRAGRKDWGQLQHGGFPGDYRS